MWRVYGPLFEEITTSATASINQRVGRVEMRYELFGYGGEEPDFAGRDGAFRYGAFQCAQREIEEGEEPHSIERPGCLMDLQRIVHEPVTQFHKTTLSVIQLGDLFLTTLPGEPSSGLGMRLGSLIEDAARSNGAEEARSFNIGYAQDHQFYLLEPDDWAQGGYEASMSTWGPYIGSYLVERSWELARTIIQGEEIPQVDRAEAHLKPTWWPNLEDDTRATPPEAPQEALITRDPPPIVKRGELVIVEWVGGDPAVDLPRVTLIDLERDEVAIHPHSGLPFTDEGFESVLHYLGDYEAEQRWTSKWDLPLQLSPGRYALQIRGNIGPDRAPYEFTSDPFELVGDEALRAHEVTRDPRQVTMKVTYVNAPSTDYMDAPFSSLKSTGSLLHLRHLPIDLSEPTARELKAWRYLLGGPVAGDLTARLWVGASPQDSPRAPTITTTLTATIEECSVEVVTARDERGTEQRQTLEGVPCTAVTFETPEGEISEEALLWIELTDRYDNKGFFEVPPIN